MKNILWWILLIFATKAIAFETFVCKWSKDGEDYDCRLISDEAEEDQQGHGETIPVRDYEEMTPAVESLSGWVGWR